MWKIGDPKRSILAWAAVVMALAGACGIGLRQNAMAEQKLQEGIIPVRTAEYARSPIGMLSRKAVRDITDVTLENTGYGKWEQFKEELEAIITEMDILPGNGKELLVALSLFPQEGMVAIYNREHNDLVYLGRVSNLMPVTAVYGLRNDFAGRELLVVDQHQDEMLGAFFNATYRDIFLGEGGRFERVLGLMTGYNAYWNKAWDGIEEGACWLWLRQTSEIRYAEGGKSIAVTGSQSILRSRVKDSNAIPEDKDFVVWHRRTVSEEYTWSDAWNRYILGECTDRLTGRRVAVLEDYRKNVSALIGKNLFDMIKVMDEQGVIRIISPEQLEWEEGNGL